MKNNEDYSIDQNGKTFLIAAFIIVLALFLTVITSAVLNPHKAIQTEGTQESASNLEQEDPLEGQTPEAKSTPEVKESH